MDALSHLFHYFPFRTDLFFIGKLCQIAQFQEKNKGYLHFIRQGSCLLQIQNQPPKRIDKPCIILSVSNTLHNIHPLDDELDIFCISFDFGNGVRNPITHTIKDTVILDISEQPDLAVIASQIFQENESRECGFQAVIHHLSAYLTLQVIRCCLKQNHFKTGLLKGLTDKYLAPVLLDMHQRPEYNWKLDELATKAAMSRSKFAVYFKNILGISPMEYLTHWRITLAQTLLLKGKSLTQVADDVGYSHNAALTRAFLRIVGKSPTDWLKLNKKETK